MEYLGIRIRASGGGIVTGVLYEHRRRPLFFRRIKSKLSRRFRGERFLLPREKEFTALVRARAHTEAR